jgi:hypothetical protein
LFRALATIAVSSVLCIDIRDSRHQDHKEKYKQALKDSHTDKHITKTVPQ